MLHWRICAPDPARLNASLTDLRPRPCQTKCFTDGSLAGWAEEGLPWLTPAGRGRWWSFWRAQGRRWAGWGGPLSPPGHGPPPTAAAGRLAGPLLQRWHPAAQTVWWKKQQPDPCYIEGKNNNQTSVTLTKKTTKNPSYTEERKKKEKMTTKSQLHSRKNHHHQTPVTVHWR